MHIDKNDLLLLWLGGGFVVALAWAALVGHALMGRRPAAIRPGIAVLATIGLVHPAAAVAAADLVRLGGTVDEEELPLPGWAGLATRSLVGLSSITALLLWIGAEGSVT